MPAIIGNFRQASSVPRVYRCASTDRLGRKLLQDGGFSGLDDDNDRFVLEEAGMLIDFRADSERKEDEAQAWMRHANVRVFEANEEYKLTNERCVLRVDVLAPETLTKYIASNWLSPDEKVKAKEIRRKMGVEKLRGAMIEKFNTKGLAGLNEAILESGKSQFCRALVAMTEHLEHNPQHSVVFHCAQGKDRTGVFAMLLQTLLGVEDEEIIEDYFASNAMLRKHKNVGSAAAARVWGQIDLRMLSGTTRKDMLTTLAFLRGKYGSVSPGYLDNIGFDSAWRARLVATLTNSRISSRM